MEERAWRQKGDFGRCTERGGINAAYGLGTAQRERRQAFAKRVERGGLAVKRCGFWRTNGDAAARGGIRVRQAAAVRSGRRCAGRCWEAFALRVESMRTTATGRGSWRAYGADAAEWGGIHVG